MTTPTTTMNDEFIVYSLKHEAYVECLDTYDGFTEYTENPRLARIFRGATWREFWSNAKYKLREVPSGDPTTS